MTILSDGVGVFLERFTPGADWLVDTGGTFLIDGEKNHIPCFKIIKKEKKIGEIEKCPAEQLFFLFYFKLSLPCDGATGHFIFLSP